jgi:phosphoenolpyruvate carboxykinase (GTP)
MRVLRWIVDRVRSRVGAEETPLGWVPRVSDLDLSGLGAQRTSVEAAMKIDGSAWSAELEGIGKFFESLGPTFPADLERHRRHVLERFQQSGS